MPNKKKNKKADDKMGLEDKAVESDNSGKYSQLCNKFLVDDAEVEIQNIETHENNKTPPKNKTLKRKNSKFDLQEDSDNKLYRVSTSVQPLTMFSPNSNMTSP